MNGAFILCSEGSICAPGTSSRPGRLVYTSRVAFGTISPAAIPLKVISAAAHIHMRAHVRSARGEGEGRWAGSARREGDWGSCGVVRLQQAWRESRIKRRTGTHGVEARVKAEVGQRGPEAACQIPPLEPRRKDGCR